MYQHPNILSNIYIEYKMYDFNALVPIDYFDKVMKSNKKKKII